MQRIEILSAEVETKSGTSTRTGKPYAIREQAAALHTTGKKYPEACRIGLGRDQQPYAPGMYDIGAPLTVGDFESLRINRDLDLVPVKAPARPA